MNAKAIRFLACFLLIVADTTLANDPTHSPCNNDCESCESGSSCDPNNSTHNTTQSLEIDELEDNEEDDDCTGSASNSNSNGGNSATDTSPGFTPLNYKREGLIFDGVAPDHIKYETVTETVEGVTTTVRKPVQFPGKHVTFFYSDLADGSGFQCAIYRNSQVTAPDANGYRSIPEGVQPVSITTYRNPDGSAETTSGRLDVIHKQRHPQTGAWVIRTIRKTCPQGNNNWKTEFYLGDPTDSPLIQSYREVTITRTPNPTDITQESTREVTKDRASDDSLVITSDLSVTYGFYKYGDPVRLAETKHTGTGSELATTWTYYTSAADPVSFNKPATMRRSDGQWANYTYQGSLVTGTLFTKTVTGWLDNAAPAIGTAPDEAANRVVLEIQAFKETGTFSREERIQGVLVSKTWGERYKDNSGMIVEKKRVETGSATLTTIRTGYSKKDSSASEANRGRLVSIEYPDGTVALHSHALQGDNLVTTIDKGAGTLSGVTDGTRTVSTHTKYDVLIKEVVSDIASGVVLSTKEAIGFDSYNEPTRWAYDNDLDDYSETLKGCCGIDSERSRDGIVTTYTRDGLKRPKIATSQGITLTYTYGSTTIGGTVFPTENVTATAGGLSLDRGTTVRDLAGNVIQQISPDLDGDGNPEITTIARDFASLTTTTTHPDDGTIITTDYADGQSQSTTGTATAPVYYTYLTHAEQGGGLVTGTASTATGLWNLTYQNLVRRTLKTTFHDGATELVLQTHTYDTVGRLISTTDADNVTTLTAYNTKGEAYRRAIDLNQNGQIDNADRVTDTLQDVIADSPIGAAIRSTTILYDLNNDPVTLSTTYRTPDGLTTRQETLGVANPSTSVRASHTDRTDGSWTDTTTNPDGTKQTVQYTNWLPVTQSRLDTAANVIESTTTGHDALRRPETRTHSRTASAVITRTAYHGTTGLVVSITDDLTTGADRVTSFAYDSMGRRIATTLPDTSVTHTTYWPTGQEKASYGSQTNPTVKLYTAEGQLHKLRTFRSANLALAPDETTTGYDETTWTYNDRNQLERKEYADTKGTDYTYTPAGRLKTRRWQRGNWTRYDYDTAGSLEATLYFTPATTESAMLAAATGNDPLTPDVIILNDKLGRQETVTQTNQSVIDYTYDPATLALDTETISYDLDQDGTADFTRVLDRKPTTLGRATGWQLKDGTTIENEVTYGYHATEGRLQSVDGGATGSFTYGYLANSSLVETVTATAGAVHTVTNVWETTRNVLDLKQNKVGTNVVSSYDYTVNAIGQRTNVSQDGTAFQAIRAISWGYDNLGQVTSADSSENAHDRAYEYDAIGNRKKSADSLTLPGTDNYASNALNQYTAVGGLSPVHDFDGNATAYPLPVAPSASSTLVWDAENRLISTTVGSATTTYLYDAQSRRIAKTTGSNTTLFVYDGWNCIAEWSADLQSASLTKTRLWGTDLSGTLQGAGGVGGLLALHIHDPQSAIYYPTYDGNGNVSEYLAADGTVTAHFEYDPFGNTVVNTDTGNLFPYRFSTKPQDAETGLYYYGYRYYDPLTGRWLSRDPIGEEGGINLYGFVGNVGVNDIDYLGLVEAGSWDDFEEAYKAAHAEVRRSGGESLEAGWNEVGHYFGLTKENLYGFPDGFRERLLKARNGAGYLTERELIQSPSGHFGIYRLEKKVLRSFVLYDWAFVMGRETAALIYCKDEKYAYITYAGQLPPLDAMRTGKGLMGRVSDAAIADLMAKVPNGGVTLHFVHSHLVDRFDVSSADVAKVIKSSVGRHEGLSLGDREYFVGNRFKGLIGISAIEDNGKTHSIRRGSNGRAIWEDL